MYGVVETHVTPPEVWQNRRVTLGPIQGEQYKGVTRSRKSEAPFRAPLEGLDARSHGPVRLNVSTAGVCPPT